jgi:DNA modification methylase
MPYEIKIGDVFSKLQEIDDDSVDCVVTSPPYYGLRDYGTGTWVGGNPDCEHQGEKMGNNRNFIDFEGRGSNNASLETGDCIKCGATRKDSQIGLEESPQQYIERLVQVFRDVRRVLKPTGTVWLNIADTYCSTGKSHGLKPKSLILIPFRLAIALQEDGWIVRQDIIWTKNNPMPESVKDRCTKAHEYIFLLTKSKKYYYNNNAILEPCISKTPKKMKNKRSVWNVNTKPYKKAHFAVYPPELIEPCILTTPKLVCASCGIGYVEKQQVDKLLTSEEVEEIKRSIIETSTKQKKPYAVIEKEFRNQVIEFRNLPQHDLLRIYLSKWRKKAGLTIDEIENHFGTQAPHHWFEKGGSYPTVEDFLTLKELLGLDNTFDKQLTQVFFKSGLKNENSYSTVAIVKDCVCETNETTKAIILDPFAGSGTTGGVAEKHGRDSILIELNPEYASFIPERIEQIVGEKNEANSN